MISRRHVGYSLVELLVSMAIAGILAGVIAAVCFHGSAAAHDASVAGRFERQWMGLRLAFVRDMANIQWVADLAFEGDRKAFSCGGRESGRLPIGRVGRLSYAQKGGVLTRSFESLPEGGVNTDSFAVPPLAFLYLDGSWAKGNWQSEWNSTGLPTAVACVLVETGERLTAPVAIAAGVVSSLAEETE